MQKWNCVSIIKNKIILTRTLLVDVMAVPRAVALVVLMVVMWVVVKAERLVDLRVDAMAVS